MREHTTAPLAAVCSRNFLLGVARSQVRGPGGGGRHTCLGAVRRSHWSPVFDRARENGSLVHRDLWVPHHLGVGSPSRKFSTAFPSTMRPLFGQFCPF